LGAGLGPGPDDETRRPGRARRAPAVGALIAIVIGAAVGVALAPVVVPMLRPHAASGPVADALRDLLAARPAGDEIAGFYRDHGDRPLWIAHGRLRAEAQTLIATLRDAASDDLSPSAYQPGPLQLAVLQARTGSPAALARAEVMLSQAFAAYAVDLHSPPRGAAMAFVDPAIATGPTTLRSALETAARAPSLAAALADARRMNPIYVSLRQAVAAERAQPGGGDPRRVALLRTNLARARALPPDLGPRYILVNPAAQTLWLYEGGQVTDQMRVVVGKRSEPTPSMIGLIRYVDLDPYWNVPPDLARGGAREVLASGPSVLAARHLEALSDWTDEAVTVPADQVDWAAVADGRQTLRLRQSPGPDNMMGKLKFMLPNPLGVYLHDTPNKALFAGQQRADSAGCVRLADADELARRLFGRDLAADPARGPEQRVDLPSPVPVYILYLTATPAPGGGVAALPDLYGRDGPLQKALAPAPPQSAAAM